MIASERGHALMVDYLAKAGADTGITDKTGVTASDLADNDEIRALLKP